MLLFLRSKWLSETKLKVWSEAKLNVKNFIWDIVNFSIALFNHFE